MDHTLKIFFLGFIIGNTVVICNLSIDQPKPPKPFKAKPDKCQAPNDIIYLQCCVFPPFFARDIAKECGAIFQVIYIDKKNNVTGLKRVAQTGCDHWQCILSKYSLLSVDNTEVDDLKYFTHLDEWVELNPEFSDVMGKAKTNCKEEYRMFLPLEVCEFYSFHACIRNFINVDCPLIRNTPKCAEQKKLFSACGEFYYRK